MTRKAYSYIRFSTPQQSKGHSYERQRQGVEAYCAEHGLDLATDPEYRFFDKGRSAWNKGEHIGEKGQLARFINLVDRRDIQPRSTLIVESLDRLSRQNVTKALPWFLGLVDKGIRVVTLNDGKVYDKEHLNELDLILSIFVLSRAHNESSTKAKRLAEKFKDKREKAATERKPMGNVCPMWLRLKDDGSGYEPIEVYVNAVKSIFDLTLQGYGRQSIARKLNEDGVPTFKQKVKGWGVSSVHHVVKNRAVLGEWQPYTKTLDPERKKREPIGDPIPNYFPAIISEAVFDRAQDAVAGRAKAQATKQTTKFNVWQGVAKCLYCGSAMHVVNKGQNQKEPSKGTTYIECSVGRKKVPGVCESYKLIRLDDSEKVFRLILARLDSMALVKDSGAKLSNDLKAVQGKMAQERARLDEYEKLLEVAPSERLARLMQESEARLRELEQQRQRVQGELAAEDAIGFDTFMERLDLESHGGRFEANGLLKRLDVLVFASREAFVVSQKGRMEFGVGVENVGTGKRWKAGRVGYLERNPWRKQLENDPPHVAAQKMLKAAGPMHSVRPIQAGALAYALEEEADQARYDALEDEGNAVGYP